MNIKHIIQAHRSAAAARDALATHAAATTSAHLRCQKQILRDRMRLQVHPLLQSFCAELLAQDVEAHATLAEEERGGDDLHSWVVCQASLVIRRGHQRFKADLQFVGSVSPENWKITAFHHCAGAPAVEATPHFIGTPADIEPFVTRQTEAFLLTLFPAVTPPTTPTTTPTP